MDGVLTLIILTLQLVGTAVDEPQQRAHVIVVFDNSSQTLALWFDRGVAVLVGDVVRVMVVVEVGIVGLVVLGWRRRRRG